MAGKSAAKPFDYGNHPSVKKAPDKSPSKKASNAPGMKVSPKKGPIK